MANKRGEALAKYLDDSNVQTFLDLISAAEATTTHGYNTAFGGGKFTSLKDHPRTLKEFTQTDGKKNKSSAAGRYQFLESTWDDVAKRLGLTSFSERNQDLGALELIRRNKALDDIVAGDFASALKKTGKTWASLPSSPYPQPKRSAEWVEQFLAANAMEKEAEVEEAQIIADVTGVAADVDQGEVEDSPLDEGALAGPVLASVFEGSPTDQPLQALVSDVPTSDLIQALGSAPLNQRNLADWASRINSLESSLTSSRVQEPWEDQLMAEAVQREGDAARENAVAALLGEEVAPQLTLPKALNQTINRLIAAL